MAPKRKRQQIIIDDIGNLTFSFGENFLNIRIEETDSFDDIINHGISDKITYNIDDVNQELHDILLEGFDRDAVMVYKLQKHKDLPKRAQTFLYKLNTVVNKKYQQVEPGREDDFVHDLMNTVLREAKFEDGTELILKPCPLRLGEESFGAHALIHSMYESKECRRGTEIVWCEVISKHCVLDEDKHTFDKIWKRGDIQLITNMIAAAQTNKLTLDRVYPERILGIKFDADRLYFYSAYITERRINELLGHVCPSSSNANSSNVPLIVKKFPKTKELSLSLYEDRKQIFMYLSAMRKYALSLDAIYAE